MTLSIVARDTKTGDFGVCGYTDIAGYGSLVPHVSLNVQLQLKLMLMLIMELRCLN